MSTRATTTRRGVKRRTDEDWTDELQRVQRIRLAADLAVTSGDRGAAWGELVRATADALSVLLAVSGQGEAEAVSAARARLKRAA